jgi:hypothetical protein
MVGERRFMITAVAPFCGMLCTFGVFSWAGNELIGYNFKSRKPGWRTNHGPQKPISIVNRNPAIRLQQYAVRDAVPHRDSNFCACNDDGH